MGYYNMSPGNLVADQLTDLERLLRALLPLEGAIAALDLLETLLRNAIQNPTEDKYRRIRTTNEKLQILFGLQGCFDLMTEIGWEREAPDSEFLVLPKTVKLGMPTHVTKILEAKSWYNKQLEAAKRANKMAQDPKKADLLKSLELDRRERGGAAAAAPAPVSTAPTAATAASAGLAAMPVRAVEEPKAEPKACDAKAQPAATQPGAKAQPKTSFDFESRQKKDGAAKEAEASLQDLRSLQKDRYKEFEKDPSARQGAAYQRPAATGGAEEPGWFDWMNPFGASGSSSSGGGGGGGYNGRDDKRPPGPRMKTINDLPKPVQRGGG